MTHDELIKILDSCIKGAEYGPYEWGFIALRAVVELHKPSSIPDWVPTEDKLMCWCAQVYPCPTIQAIEKELK